MTNNNNIIIGIDLGTTNSVVSVLRNKKVEIITDKMGNKLIPSIVAFYNSIRLVGIDAKNINKLQNSQVIYDVKRIIGLSFSDKNIAPRPLRI